ncbi:MAG TPA: type II secretion system protein GspK [Phycisphaerales bacterium]|nr:type II secretion system protein GspK [Phycisphaerales bacterium]
MVLWTIALTAVVLVATQAAAWRDAGAGRQAVAEVRARWAARAGLEAMVAALAAATLDPQSAGGLVVLDDLAEVAEGTLWMASYGVSHDTAQGPVVGPSDAHSRPNVNLLNEEELMTLPGMTPDIAQAIMDWTDPDDDARESGAESGHYLSSRRFPYAPRNAPMRSIAELELVAGVTPQMVRGEDWNLNGLLDPEEDDGPVSWPPDDADGVLSAGWSGLLTSVSASGGLGRSGEERLDLASAEDDEIAEVAGLSLAQAQAIAAYAAQEGATMAELLRTDPASLPGQEASASPTVRGAAASPEPLTNEQLAALFDECSIGPPAAAGPGRLNVNTCPPEVFEYLPSIDPAVADAIMFEREARRSAGGFASVIDLLEIPSMSRARLADLVELLDVTSNVYCVTSRGRDHSTGLEVELVAVVDRSSLPIVIQDLRTP